MKMLRLYYLLKPLMPSKVRITARRCLARRVRHLFRYTWPIDERAGDPPPGWRGWPDGKQFAFVLTHDVEGPTGLARCEQVMKLETELGFRSCINLVPEGSYEVTDAFRTFLKSNGFEVGVHDLTHDGKLFASRDSFQAGARVINRYLAEWHAVGFRAGLMRHNLDWLRSLNVAYDASTFDTDPFEPQPDGVRTIFPFRVPRADGSHYVELPYTLPQDSCLFVIHEEKSIDIWKQKLDWIAAKGGMALVNVHPDYINFSAGKIPYGEYPASYYRELLEYVRKRYAEKYWHALPRRVAGYVSQQSADAAPAEQEAPARLNYVYRQPPRLWIDLDNTPHVPFFEPIIRELEARGYSLLLTGRDAFQVCELAALKDMKVVQVGRHHGKNRIAKFVGLHYRSLQLSPAVYIHNPALGLSHGSRAQVILCKMMHIPSVVIGDYEHAKSVPFVRPTWNIVPQVIPLKAIHGEPGKCLFYPGIKEDVYVPYFRPDPGLAATLGLDRDKIVVTVRPPATEAHYHNPESEVLFTHLMEKLCAAGDVQVVLLPRNRHQAEELQAEHARWFGTNVIIPRKAVDGLNLIWHSDLVVSGGGTMNREAAALGVPVYSIFRGKIGAVDRHLNAEGRLILVQTAADVAKIRLRRRHREWSAGFGVNRTLDAIVEHIEHIYRTETQGQGLRP